MGALGAVEEVLFFALLALGGGGVGVWIRDFGEAAVVGAVDGVVPGDGDGEGGGREDIAGGGRVSFEEGLGRGGREYGPVFFGEGEGDGHGGCGGRMEVSIGGFWATGAGGRDVNKVLNAVAGSWTRRNTLAECRRSRRRHGRIEKARRQVRDQGSPNLLPSVSDLCSCVLHFGVPVRPRAVIFVRRFAVSMF